MTIPIPIPLSRSVLKDSDNGYNERNKLFQAELVHSFVQIEFGQLTHQPSTDRRQRCKRDIVEVLALINTAEMSRMVP